MKLSPFMSAMIISILSVVLVEVPFSFNAHAGMISTSRVVERTLMKRERNTVQNYLDRSEVQKELIKFGISPEEASLRLASLTQSEVKSLAVQIEQGRAGGEVVIVSVGTILLVILILILLGRV